MEPHTEGLSKKEKKALFRTQKQQERSKEETKQKWAKLAGGVLIVAIFIAGGWYIFSKLSAPLPGNPVSQLGRKHVPNGTKVSYNSNPPTSGDHYGDWAKTGVYPSPLVDENLVHSLEHGYIILSYNCTKVNSKLENSQTCKDLVKQLSDVASEVRLWKIIVVPRVSLDVPLALTAWGRIDKIQAFDKERIIRFVTAFRDHGPEKTME